VTRSQVAVETLGTFYLLLPLLGGAVVHGACMKYGWFGFLVRPMDAGRRLGGRAIFGHSKTFRGPIMVAVGAWAVHGFQRGASRESAPTARPVCDPWASS
jgi:hypothetical protein